jgi:hypothetical protein
MRSRPVALKKMASGSGEKSNNELPKSVAGGIACTNKTITVGKHSASGYITIWFVVCIVHKVFRNYRQDNPFRAFPGSTERTKLREFSESSVRNSDTFPDCGRVN